MDLKPTERAILVDLLVHGDDKAANIGNRTNNHRNTVSKYMGGLERNGYISGKGGGVYRLTDMGRESARALIRAREIPYSSESEDID